jgi:hypothetical protein
VLTEPCKQWFDSMAHSFGATQKTAQRVRNRLDLDTDRAQLPRDLRRRCSRVAILDHSHREKRKLILDALLELRCLGSGWPRETSRGAHCIYNPFKSLF